MDENVLFNKNQSNQEPGTDQPTAQDANQPQQPVSNPVTPVSPAPVTDANGIPVAQPNIVPPADPVAAPVDPSNPSPVEAGAATPPPPPPPAPGFMGGGMLKKILIGVGILVFLIILIFMFMPKGQTTQQQVKLQWWGLWEENSATQAIIADFKKDHPTIDVEYQKRSPQEYRERLLARIENGSGPDIFRYHNTWRPMLDDVLLPLSSDVITADQFTESYYPVIQKDLVTNGAIYGIPLYVDSLALYVNPEIFEAAGAQVPNNWDDFVKVSKQLTVKDSSGKIKTAGAALGTYDNITHAPDIISLLFVQQGVQMDKFTAKPETQENALKFYASFSEGEENVWDASLDNSILAFSRGNLAMYFGYSWDVFAIQKLNKDLQFKVYPVPGLPGKRTTIASYWVEGVNAKSKNQKAALEFMKYLAQKETAEKFYAETAKTRAFGEPYARKDLRENLREEPMVYPFLSQMDDASSTMFSSDTHDGDDGLNTLLNTYLGNTIRSITVDTDSPDKAVDTLNSGVKSVYKKYGIKEAK